MAHASTLTLEDCWAHGGRLRLEVKDEGGRVALSGNPEGFIGLARVLLWMVQNGEEQIDLTTLRAHADGDPILELLPPIP